MSQLTLLPSKILRTRSQEIDVSKITTSHYQNMIEDMIKTMHKNNGIGLAAPQIGINERLIIVSHADGDMAVFNPVLSEFSFRKAPGEEGCLSVPGVFGMVKRHTRLLVNGYNADGEAFSLVAHGLLARIFQHELDHIDGKLFIDRASHILQGEVPQEPSVYT